MNATSSDLNADRPDRTWPAGVLLVALLLAARLAVVHHPTPIHGDEDRFAAGVEYAIARVTDRPPASGTGLGAITDSGDAGAKVATPAAGYPVHAPGYPLWIAMALPWRFAGASSYTAMMISSIACSVIEPLVLWQLARRMVGRSIAWPLALAFGLTPIYWFHAAAALNYVAGSMLATLIAFAAWRAVECAGAPTDPVAVRGSRRWLTTSFAICLVGAGVRPDLLLWMTPLLIHSARRCGRRQAATTSALLIGATLFWGACIAWLYSGAVATSAGPNLGHTFTKLLATSVFRLGPVDGLLRNSIKVGLTLAWGMAPLALGGVAAIITHRAFANGAGRRIESSAMRRPFLLWWLAPAAVFNMVIHMSEPGHAIWHVAPLTLAIGVAVQQAFGRRAAAAAWAAAVACAAQFWFYPWSADSGGAKRLLDAKVAFVSRQGLMHIDQRGRIHSPGDFWRTGAHNIPD